MTILFNQNWILVGIILIGLGIFIYLMKFVFKEDPIEKDAIDWANKTISNNSEEFNERVNKVIDDILEKGETSFKDDGIFTPITDGKGGVAYQMENGAIVGEGFKDEFYNELEIKMTKSNIEFVKQEIVILRRLDGRGKSIKEYEQTLIELEEKLKSLTGE